MKQLMTKIKQSILNRCAFIFKKRLLGIRPPHVDFVEPNYYIINNFDENSVIVDIGTGYNADFSQDMILKYHLKCYGFDPTRKHAAPLKIIESQSDGKFIYKPLALSSKEGVAEFHESEDNVSGSFSLDHVNVKRDRINSYTVKVVTIESLFKILSVNFISLIKMDVEGEEYSIINSLPKSVADKIGQFIIEFHHHCIDKYSIFNTLNAVKKMSSLGFVHYSEDGINYLFYRKNE